MSSLPKNTEGGRNEDSSGTFSLGDGSKELGGEAKNFHLIIPRVVCVWFCFHQ